MSAQPTAKARKRAAVAEVRELAASLGVTVSREKTDLKEPEFAALQRELRGHCNSPAHQAALERAWKRFKGEEVEEEEVQTSAAPEAATEHVWVLPRACISRFRESPGTSCRGGGNLQDCPRTLPGTSFTGSENLHPVCRLKLYKAKGWGGRRKGRPGLA